MFTSAAHLKIGSFDGGSRSDDNLLAVPTFVFVLIGINVIGQQSQRQSSPLEGQAVEGRVNDSMALLVQEALVGNHPICRLALAHLSIYLRVYYALYASRSAAAAQYPTPPHIIRLHYMQFHYCKYEFPKKKK